MIIKCNFKVKLVTAKKYESIMQAWFVRHWPCNGGQSRFQSDTHEYRATAYRMPFQENSAHLIPIC